MADPGGFAQRLKESRQPGVPTIDGQEVVVLDAESYQAMQASLEEAKLVASLHEATRSISPL